MGTEYINVEEVEVDLLKQVVKLIIELDQKPKGAITPEVDELANAIQTLIRVPEAQVVEEASDDAEPVEDEATEASDDESEAPADEAVPAAA